MFSQVHKEIVRSFSRSEHCGLAEGITDTFRFYKELAFIKLLSICKGLSTTE